MQKIPAPKKAAAKKKEPAAKKKEPAAKKKAAAKKKVAAKRKPAWKKAAGSNASSSDGGEVPSPTEESGSEDSDSD